VDVRYSGVVWNEGLRGASVGRDPVTLLYTVQGLRSQDGFFTDQLWPLLAVARTLTADRSQLLSCARLQGLASGALPFGGLSGWKLQTPRSTTTASTSDVVTHWKAIEPARRLFHCTRAMTGATESERASILARHADEREAFAKDADKARARIPRKERARRARLAEDLDAGAATLAARHAEELAESGIELPAAAAGEDVVPSSAPPGFGLSEAAGGKENPRKESKAARRRRQKAEADAESERRVAVEKAGMGPSERLRETDVIVAQLAPRGLRIRDIPPDGHCLYAALADQLRETSGEGVVRDVAALRAVAAEELLAERAEYLPFLENVECDDAKYEAYCKKLRTEAVWGGQVELRALSNALRRRVEVFAAGMPVLITGEEFSSEAPLRLSFHRHYYNLGDHYNSVVVDAGCRSGEGKAEASNS
jgi:OTU domain-containing protein 6